MSFRSAADPSAFTCPRRQLLIGAGAGGVALLAACSTSNGSAVGSGSTGGSGTSTGGAGSTKPIIALSSVPTNSSVSVQDPTGRTLLITLSGGKLTALDATCTHMACTVQPDGKILQCPCHFSQYTLTGSVIQGPAPAALHPVSVKVVSGQVVLA